MKKIVVIFLFPLLAFAQINVQFMQMKPAYRNQLKFDYVAAIQSWTVPAGVTKIFVDVAGAQGANVGSISGGQGGKVSAMLTVVPGTVLRITVGGQSTNNIEAYGFGGRGGFITANSTTFSGGGAGGGLSAISTATPVTQQNAIIIAAGGGGACVRYLGGPGGGTAGINGLSSNSQDLTYGRGATQSVGGAPGTPVNTNTTLPTAGTDISGGEGGIADGSLGWGGGGGGGAGYYGGGGGAAGILNQGGGGGGSSWTAVSSTVTDVVNVSDFNTGHGRVVIYWN